MKRNIKLSIIGWLLGCIGGLNVEAQTVDIIGSDNNNKKETQEIIIRKKGDKDTKLTMEISSDKILINGKPIAEFNEDGLTINNRKVIIRDGNKVTFDFGKKIDDELEKNFKFNIEKNFDENNLNSDIRDEKSYTFLGVNTEKNEDGAVIISVIKNSPAEKAGLQKDDVIYKINDSKIEKPSSLSDIIRAMKPGDKAKVYFLRNGKKKDEKITLAENKMQMSTTRVFSFTKPDGSVKTLTIPNPPMPPSPPGFEENWGKNFDESFFEPRRPKLGLKIQDTEEGNGVKVLEVEETSASATAGLLKDDLITEIGNVKVKNTDDAREQLQQNSAKNNYSIKAKRNGNEMTFTIKIPKKLKTANL